MSQGASAILRPTQGMPRIRNSIAGITGCVTDTRGPTALRTCRTLTGTRLCSVGSWRCPKVTDAQQIDFEVDSDDEFGGDYDEPGNLRPDDVSGTVVYTLDWNVTTVIDQIDADPDDPESTGVLVTSPPF